MKREVWDLGVMSSRRRQLVVSRRRAQRGVRGLLEELETRLAPAMFFDIGTGLLRVVGDATGATDDLIDISITSGEFVAVALNGETRSGDPASPEFDPRLAGATSIAVRRIEVFAAAGDDAVRIGDGFVTANGQILLHGGPGSDRLTGGAQNERMRGGDGDDTIVGGDGDDTLRGSPGQDSLLGGDAHDFLGGGRGSDFLDGGNGDDTLAGRQDDDALDGGPGRDLVSQMVDADQILTNTSLSGQGGDSLANIEAASLTGGSGANRLDASAYSLGSVTLEGAAGNDTLRGGAADDSLAGGADDDTLIGGAGTNTLDGGLGGEGLLIDGPVNISFNAATGRLGVAGDVDGPTADSILVSVENIEFLQVVRGAITFSSDPASPNFHASLAGVTLTSLRSFTILGLEGDDTLGLGDGVFLITPQAVFDFAVLDGGAGNDRLQGNAVISLNLLRGAVLFGGDGNDTLIGHDGRDNLVGGPGDDSLDAGPGGDGLDGGAGEDFLSAGDGNDVVIGGPGVDTILSGSGSDSFGNEDIGEEFNNFDFSVEDTFLPEADSTNAADTTNTDVAWTGTSLSLDGREVEIGQWDGGHARLTHQEFGVAGVASARIVVAEMNSAIAESDHGTNVAGVLIADGDDAAARGMAPGATIRSYNLGDDLLELQTDSRIWISNHSYSTLRGWRERVVVDCGDGLGARLTDYWRGDPNVPALPANIPGREDAGFGRYDAASVGLDQILSDSPDLIVLASPGNNRGENFTNARGNGAFRYQRGGGGPFFCSNTDPAGNPGLPAQDGGANGFDSIPNGLPTAKNAFLIGSIPDQLADPIANPAAIAPNAFPGFGPTDDGRLGVSLVANGDAVHMPGRGDVVGGFFTPSDTDYDDNSGVSFSLPNATGSLALALQHFKDTFGDRPPAATTKGLALHTALDLGLVGPDYQTGYGLLDMAALTTFVTCAKEAVPAGEAIISDVLGQGQTWTRDLPSRSNVTATLMWTDPPGTADANDVLDEATPDLVNDLDLRIERLDALGNVVETFNPWRLDRLNPAAAATTGDNNVDVVEQVVAQGISATYRLRVTHKGTTLIGASQAFSLIVSSGALTVTNTLVGGLRTITFNDAVAGHNDCLILRRGTDDPANPLDGLLEYSTDGTRFSSDLDSATPGLQSQMVATIDRIHVNLGGGNDQVILDYASGNAAGPTRAGLAIQFDGGAGTDRFVDTRSGAGAVTLTGDAASATLSGGGRTDTLLGVEAVDLTGDPTLADNISAAGVTSTTAPIHVVFRGLGGNDTLNGGSGNDSLFGGLGNDNLTGNGGTDMVIESRDRNMTLGNAQLNVDPAGINEIDTLATIERAKLTGGPGANTITAAGFTNGAVEINGGFGNDVLTGGDSTTEADTINGGPGSDNVNGGLGLLDIVKMEAEARGTTLTVVSANQATSQAMLGGMFETLATDTLANFEAVSLIGSPGNDSFRNDSPLTATLSGGAGNDTYLFANVTANTVVVVNEPVNAGTDTLNLSALTAAVTFNLTVQNATRATTGGFTLGIDLQDGAAGNGAANFENVVGSSTVANTLVGNAAANRLTGGAAADALTGNAGNDTLNGGTGDDRYLFAADSPLGTDTILEPGGASADVLDFLLTTTQNLVIDLNIPTAQTVCPNLMLVLGGNDTIEYVFGGSGNDSITGNGLNNSLTGGAGNDTLRGHSGTDSTINVSGTDTLAGDAGTDELTYDIPNVQNRPVTVNLGLSSATNDGFGTQDIVSGFEKLVGTRGSDLLEGDDLANVIEGLNGRDTVRGLGGNDSLVGNRGEDVLEGGAGNDTLEGVGRKDRLYGGSRDSENNGTGNDCLLGGNGADTLRGGDGNDSYDGGVGDGDDCKDFDQNPVPGPQFLGCERGEP